MINCITKNDMKFGEYFIPARTKAKVINTPSSKSADVPGLQLTLAVSFWDMTTKDEKKKGVPLTKLQFNNELENNSFGNTDSQLKGIVIATNGTQVYLDAEDSFYEDARLSKWQVEKIFEGKIPESITPGPYTNKYSLSEVVCYLEEEFAEWVRGNCHFRKITKREIENGEAFDGASPGDKTLSGTGLEQFYNKQLEYQARLETTGFTYEFKGGLYWK